MRSIRILFFILFVFLIRSEPKAQLVINPIVGSKTHASMSIDSMVLSDENTRCFIKVVNQNTEGNAWFCADEDIVLIELESKIKHELLESKGIPTCPEVHAFSHPGEVLLFELVFPSLVNRMGDVDIVEQCAQHCFSLKDIVLDPMLNQEIRLFEEGLTLFQNNRLDAALAIFEKLISSPYKEEKHFAYSTYILPVLYWKLGEEELASEYYRALKTSSIVEKDYFLKKIREIPFFKSLD
jgi:tetratricopeptide (TPR) repeat protein